MPIAKRNQVPANLWQSIKPHQSLRHFENTLIQFHYLHKTPIRQLPYVLGKKINLRKLYISVIKRGGYKKVNEKDAWEDVLGDLNLPKEATNSEFAIQTIYHRYLEDYERNEWNRLSSRSFIDNNTDNNQIEFDFSKYSTFISELAVRDKSCLALFVYENTPKIYSDYRHIISNMSRLESGLSCDLKEASELKHLIMSLKSGLCNEIDFALNTLLIMSNNDRISFDLRFTGELLDLLITMTGIVDLKSGSYYEQFKNYEWMKESLKFWNKIVEDGVGRMFLVPNIFTCSKTDIKQLQRDCHMTKSSGFSELFNDDNQYQRIVDSCCQRVHLVTTIIHNLAIKSLFNCQVLVNNYQTLRLLLLAVHSRDPVLRRLALHTVTKLRFVLFPIQDCPETGRQTLLYDRDEKYDAEKDKEEESEDEWFTEFLLDFLMSLLSSENRCDRISAYEMIQSLCLIEDNHETLSKHLQNPFIIRISSQLLVPDIHPLCCALEALVALSQLGEDMCRRMAMCQSLLKCLLQFVTIEAQMFGPSAVYKIKTFNCRPPIPAANYHSLRLPTQAPFRALAPFPQPGTHFIPSNANNISHTPIRSPAVPNSISANCLSMPNVVLGNHQMQSLSSPYIINQTVPPLNRTQLSPFQQIDHLLTKTIASFSSPSPVIEQSQIITKTEENVIPNNEEQMEDADVSYAKIESSDEKKTERRIVKIKCCVEGVDLEIEDINGAHRLTGKALVNGITEENREEESQEAKTELDKLIESDPDESPSPDDYLYHNGTTEDPDRRQMPPPSLPTPSMLKKQLRPKISSPITQNATTNGFFPSQQQQLQQQSADERCDLVKSWLKKNFQVTDNAKLFITKNELVDELTEALFEYEDSLDVSDNAASKTVLSPQELHNCIKEIFGSQVQVKVEHGVNGSTQLIYSHLGRIGPDNESHKLAATNGIVASEMNGFVNHNLKRKTADNDDGEDNISQKKIYESNGDEMKHDKSTIEDPIIVDRIVTVRKKYSRGRKTAPTTIVSRLKKRYRRAQEKHPKIAKCLSKLSTPPESAPINHNTLVNVHMPQINDPSTIYAQIPCLWENCSHRCLDDVSLQTHVTNVHLTTVSNTTSTRTNCLWRDCPTGHIARAPLSLLSHIVQEHCTIMSQYQSPAVSLRPGPPINTTFNIVPAPSTLCSPPPPSALNTMLSSTMKPSMGNTGSTQLLEKSGWSVLYDHFRIDEQTQSHLPEGPITKHIRISSSIILRNMSRHSIIAKEFLRTNEKYLSLVAMSNQDCSSIIVQCLDELSHHGSVVASDS